MSSDGRIAGKAYEVLPASSPMPKDIYGPGVPGQYLRLSSVGKGATYSFLGILAPCDTWDRIALYNLSKHVWGLPK